jgi:hypothetical protein
MIVLSARIFRDTPKLFRYAAAVKQKKSGRGRKTAAWRQESSG